MRTLEINGINFEVTVPRKGTIVCIDRLARTSGLDLSSYYERPSEYKKAIYNDWFSWYIDTNDKQIAEIRYFGVSGANCMQFSLSFLVEYNGKIYVAWITRDHNRLTFIEDVNQ